MSAVWTRRVLFAGVVAMVAAATGGAACGGAAKNNPKGSGGGGAGSGGEGGMASDGGINLSNPTVKSVTIDPPSASMTLMGGATGMQPFQMVAKLSNGTTQTITSGAVWTSDQLSVGGVSSAGLYTANGSLGGVVHVQASYMGLSATATLTVKLLVQENPASAMQAVETSLQGATSPDPSVVWAYPYDKTVWPRGLTAPVLQWNGGAATDVYYLHVVSPTYELQELTTATGSPASQLQMSANDWAQFTDSTAGAAQVTVARWDGTTATVITQQTWTIASASMRGTIYYWANNLGRIMRLDPGGAPVDFSSGVVPTPTQGCSMACHTVAANGSAMTVAGGTFGGTYDLQTNAMGYSVGAGENAGAIRQWGLASISPKGDLAVVNALMDPLTGLTPDGIYQTSNGAPVANSGLSSEKTFMPAFSPDGSGFVFVTGSFPNTAYWLATGAPGPTAPTDPTWGWLKAYDFNEAATPMFTNERQLIGPGTDPAANVIAWPTMSADGNWVIYSRLGWVDPSQQHNLSSYPGPSGPDVNGDLYMASVKNAGVEVRLGNLDGDSTKFAAGARDLHLNFEPSAAPVASGGYFWVVLHSRRTYGNTLTGDRSTCKQLWVAAIDLNPQPGVDPSHPAFWLPGQDTTTLNLRGYWSLPPCAQDGQGCTTGTDCCGGYCTTAGDGGAPVCQSMSSGCSQDGNACTQSSDCCNPASVCINHVCSEPTPQ